MSLASPALLLAELYTHSSRCGLEECRQLRWLIFPKSGGQSTSFWFVAGKSSVTELPLNLTWNVYVFSGFLRRTSGQALQAQRTRLQDDSAF
jgi:hypothetical protein